MIVTVFRSRLRPEALEEYSELARRMGDLAKSMRGYISHKVFTADDGERVTIIEFESEEAQRNWSTHAEHMQAKARGRSTFYSEYSLQVCSVVRESRFGAK